MVRVKICGVTRKEDVVAAVDAGADAIGFISGFPKSPRNLELERAAELADSVPPFVDSVLVAPPSLIELEAAAVRAMHPDAIQVHGGTVNASEVRKRVKTRLLKVYRVGRRVPPAASRLADGFDALLTDTYSRGLEGGTGRVSDWSVCSALKRSIAPLPLILSGGLTPENVAEAVARVRPYAVDVSSGVERYPGAKDNVKVTTFIRNAKGGR